MTIPDAWRGPYSPIDPLREQPRPFGAGTADPAAETARRVEQERAAFQDALNQTGVRIQRGAR